MQVTVLGPLSIVRGSHDVTPSAPKLRQVFTLLASCANSVVQHERFIEELWEQGPPSSVSTTLQTYIYQLRKSLRLDKAQTSVALGPDAGPALRTSHSGYILTLPVDAIDSYRFEEVSRRGMQEMYAGNVYAAAATMSEALRLWYGTALVDVESGPILSAERLRLEELRKTVLEQRIDADLLLGRHVVVLGELTRLLCAAPTNERFAGQLMLALHRSGHRTGALRIYETVRRALDEQLGLDPSAALQRLHRAVLNGDDDPAPHTAAQPVPVVVNRATPCHLPPRAGELVHRVDEIAVVLKEMAKAGDPGPRVVSITGAPGSGKSALAVHAAYELRAQYPDGQLYAQLIDGDGRRADIDQVFLTFLRALGIEEYRLPSSVKDCCRMFRSLTADRRVLVLLDDLTGDDQLELLSPVGTECGVLASSRVQLSHSSIRESVHVGPLDVAGGLEMIESALGGRRTASEAEAAERLVRLCNGLPAAIQTCMDKLRARPHWPLTRAIRWITEDQDRAGQAPADPLHLRSRIERTYWSLTREARELFGLVTDAAQEHLSVRAVAETFGLDEYEAETLLDALAEAQLIDVLDDGQGGFRYGCLPTLKAAGRGLPLFRLPR